MLPMIFRAPPETSSGNAGDALSDALGGASGELFVQATADQVLLPAGFNPATADFVRAGPDLMLSAPDGTQVLVADFFMMQSPPALVGEDGARIDGDLAMRLAGPAAPGQYAGPATGEVSDIGDVIGRVTDLNGQVTVIRADGSRMTLQVGDTVYQGDILDTDLESAVGILLADGTSLAVGEEARLVLDEMVYDPGTQDGSIALSVMKGVFTIVSGEISKTSPDAMQVHTPVATIGIRGTQIGLDFSDGQNLTLVMMEEADGFVGEVTIINDGGAMTLNEAYYAVTVGAFTTAPMEAPVFTVDRVVATFGNVLSHLPTADTNANDYGQQTTVIDDVAAFNTAAGDLELDEQGLASFETAPDDNVPVEDGLADVDMVAVEEVPTDEIAELGEFVSDAGDEGLADFEAPPSDVAPEETAIPTEPVLSADELAAEADVVFGGEAEPVAAPEPVAPPPPPVEEIVPLAQEPEPTPEPEPVPVPVNVAPVAEAGTAILAEDNAFSGQLTASDLEGGGLSFSLADEGGPAHGSVSVNPDGTFTYIPETDFGGLDSFTYMVTDDAGAMALATVSVTVTPVADVPQIAAADVAGFEDSAIALTLAASMPVGTSESIASLTLSGVPAGASLSAGSDNGDGTWDISPDQLSGLSLTPPKDFNGSIELGVRATSTDGGVATSSFGLHVGPVSDIPQLAVADVSGAEDSSILLTIATAMPSTTGETVDSILLTGVPSGATLSAGTDNGDGTWTLAPTDLGSLTLNPPSDFNGVFDIGVNVTSSDGGVATGTFAVNINPVADTPVVATVDVIGAEDATIALTLAASMPAGTSETIEAIIISNVPDGATLSAGTDNGDGTWTLTPDQLSLLTLSPPSDYSGAFNLSVVATSTDGGTASGSLGVTVQPAADVPQLAVADAVGAEDSAIALTLAASMPAGTTEALHTITIEGLPTGATLSAGIDNEDGTWTLTPDLMDGLSLTPPQDYNGSFDLTITAVSTDGGAATGSLGVNVMAVADNPVVAVSDASGAEDGSIALTIAASMPGGTSESVESIIITGVPDGASLSAGTDNGDGSWTLAQSDLDGLTMNPPADFNGAFNLGVNVTSTDGGVASGALTVNVGAVSDIPVIAASDVVGNEDGSIALTLAAGMPANTTETLASITITGLPDGASLSAGTDNGDGTWSVSADDLSNLVLNPPADYNGTINLGITAVSSDGGIAASAFNVGVVAVPDVPHIAVSNVSGAEDTAIALDIAATMGADTSETVASVTITGMPDGATLSAGTDNGGGTWTLSVDQLDGLSLTPPEHYSGAINLGVSAVSSDGGIAASAASIDVGAVADAPVLTLSVSDGFTTPATSTVALENLGSSAGFNNTIGYYTLDENGEPSVGHIIWANVKDDIGEVFHLDDLDPASFGVFLLSDGASENDGLFDGQSVTFAQDVDGNWQAFDVDGVQLSYDPRGGLFFTHETFNTDGVDYEMDTAAPGNMNWEDLLGGGDQDFNDVNLNIDWTPNPVSTTFNVYVTAGLVDADGSETLSITVAGVPLDAVLSAGMNNGDGTWELFPDQLSGLTLTVPGNVTDDFSLTVSATATEADGGTATTTESVLIDVPTPPDVVVEDVSGSEDTAIALDITADGADTITISGLPEGAELSAGTDNGDGTWNLTADQLDGLSLTPPSNYSGTISLDIIATSGDGSTDADAITVNVGAVADVPVLSVEIGDGVTSTAATAMSLENLGSSAGFDNTIGYYTLDENGEPSVGQIIWANVKQDVGDIFTLDNVDPANFGVFLLSDGDRENDGLINGQSVSFAKDADGNWQVFDADGTQLTFDPSGGLFFTHEDFNTGGVDYVVDSAAPGNLNWEDLAGGGDQDFNDVNMNITWTETTGGTTYDLYITSALADVDGSETLALTVAGVPLDAELSAGTNNGDGTWTLSPGDLADLTLTVPGSVVNDFALVVTATASEADGGQASATDSVLVDVAVAPVLDVEDVGGAEDNAIALDISATVAGTTQTLESVRLSGVPDGASLSAGTDNGDGTWTLSADQLDGVTLTPPTDFSGSIVIGISATSTDGASVSTSFSVTVTPVADAPVITVANVGGGEDSAIALVIAATMPDSTNETLASVTITGVPDGAILSAGTDNGSGSWSVSPDQLDGLTLTPPSNYSGTILLGVAVVSSDGGISTTTFNATVTPVVDVPVLQVSDVVVTVEAPPGEEIEGTRRADELYGTLGDDEIEGESGHDVIYGDGDDLGEPPAIIEELEVALDISAALTDIDGSEALSIEIAGVPQDANLNVGSDNGDGTWTLLGEDLEHLDELSLTLAEGTALDNFALDVTATSSEEATGETATTTGTIDVTFAGGLGGGDDEIDGGKGSDIIYGGGGDDEIEGGRGHDELYGEDGDDTIEGGDGYDVLVGGAGDDILKGGNEADSFVFHAGDGNDIILDLGHQDVLRFEGQEFNMDDFILKSDEEHETTTITFGGDAGVSVTLNDVSAEPGEGYSVTQDGDAVVVTFDKDSID